jgi:Glucose / Sorbosone dehydrogenase
VRLAAIAIFFLLGTTAAAPAASLELVGTFAQPIFVSSDPSNPNRLLVVERQGHVVQVNGGTASELADLTSLVSCCAGERGLLSIAPAADFAAKGRFFAAYTGKAAAGGAEGDLHVDGFMPAASGLVREPLLTVGHADHPTHNGGQLQMGPDGYLYLSTGDGGGAGDPLGSGQNPASPLGKILRLEPHPGGTVEVWSHGLRNPWRFSFDRLSGDMVIADVGQGLREEVDLAPSPALGVVGGAAANYGWNCREGLVAYPNAPESCDGATGFTDPVFDYPHEDPEDGSAHGCAITGGYVIRDPGLGDLYGRYLYSDFCVGDLRSLLLPSALGGPASGDRSEGLSIPFPVSFGEDSCGRLYVVSHGGGVYRLRGDGPAACAPQAAPATVPTAAVTGRQTLPRVRLRARLGQGGRVALTARVLPCGSNAGKVVQLNRGGQRFRWKRLDSECAARFHARVASPSTFRALFAGQRSQVRTIAFAKPRP